MVGIWNTRKCPLLRGGLCNVLPPPSPFLSLHHTIQDVCEHFEGILKLLSLVKSLVLALPTTEVGVVKTVGILTLLPDGQELGGALYDSCVLLIQHIMSQQPNVVASPSSKEKVSKEVIE